MYIYGTRFLIQLPSFDPNDPGTNAGDPAAGGGNPNPGAGGGNPNPNPNAGPAATSTGTGYKVGADGTITDANGKRVYVYTEDRGDYVPRHRLNEVTGKHQTAEQQLAALKSELEVERRRIAALAGVNPKDPKAAEQEEVEETLSRILESRYPALARLKQLKPEQFDAIINGSMAGQSAQEAAADAQRDAAFESVYAEAAKLLRTDKLTDRQMRGLREAFASEFQAAMRDRMTRRQRGEADDPNDFVGRYLRNDKALWQEFAKAYLDDWYEPARRNVTATVVRRNTRPVPNGGRSETVVTGGVTHDLTTEDGFKKALIGARNATQSGA